VQDDDGVVQLRLLDDISSDGVRLLREEAARLTEWLAGLRVGTVYRSPLMRAVDDTGLWTT
jgi:hypothetical protein